MTEAQRNRSDTYAIGGDLEVRRLGFGAMRVTGEGILGPPPDEAAAISLIERAMDMGVDLIDTADSYGPGTSERLLRAAGVPDRAVVATKGGLLRNPAGDWLPHGPPAYLRNQVLCSLDRLGVETIDLYQLHRPDPDVPFEDSVHALAEMRDRGRIRHIGLSNVSVDQLEAARDVVEIATVQNRYNVGNREHEPVLEACATADIGFIPWGPLYAADGDIPGPLRTVADELEATPHQVAIAWLLEHASVTLPIPGTSDPEHLAANVAASEIALDDDQKERLDDVDPTA